MGFVDCIRYMPQADLEIQKTLPKNAFLFRIAKHTENDKLMQLADEGENYSFPSPTCI